MIPTRAFRLDAPTIVSLRDDLARWQASEGIEPWRPGEDDVETVRDQIGDGQWWVLRDDGAVNATVRLLDSDPDVWDDLVDPGADDGAYVRGLMVRRLHAGRGIGERMLDFAAGVAAERGRSSLRLDCAHDNTRLCRYYLDLGFVERGSRTFDGPWGTLRRFEKPVG